MRLFSLFGLLLLTALPRALASSPAFACLHAAAVAEHDWRLPPDIVAAIGRVESGRTDRRSGQVFPWPWTVNANGSGYYFATSEDAIAFVRALHAQGVRLIDVGCFQVDLFYHPAAFANLDQAFDPAANADYAAHFLAGLHDRTGDWMAAVASYHSAQPVEGAAYREQVMRRWQAGDTLSRSVQRTGRSAEPAQPDLDRYVRLMSDVARAIPVIGPGYLPVISPGMSQLRGHAHK